MSRRSTSVLLNDIRDHAREAVAFAQHKSRADIAADRLLELALTRLLEIIGEAASHIPKQDQLRYRQIPWTQIISLRNRLIHGYDSVDLDILWQIVTSDLPPLIAALDTILSSKSPE